MLELIDQFLEMIASHLKIGEGVEACTCGGEQDGVTRLRHVMRKIYRAVKITLDAHRQIFSIKIGACQQRVIDLLCRRSCQYHCLGSRT